MIIKTNVYVLIENFVEKENQFGKKGSKCGITPTPWVFQGEAKQTILFTCSNRRGYFVQSHNQIPVPLFQISTINAPGSTKLHCNMAQQILFLARRRRGLESGATQIPTLVMLPSTPWYFYGRVTQNTMRMRYKYFIMHFIHRQQSQEWNLFYSKRVQHVLMYHLI